MSTTPDSLQRVGSLLLEVGTALMSAGANTLRIRLTVERIAQAFGCHVHLLVTHRALMLTLVADGQSQAFSSVKRAGPQVINFRVVSGISRMSWRVAEEQWTVDQAEEELNRLLDLPHYPRALVLLMVGLAGGAFCRLLGGHYADVAVAGVATIAGLFIRQEAIRLRFNPYVSIFLAAAASAVVANTAAVSGLTQATDVALATSVLYLVPGVPLINCFSDLIDGNTMNGVMRGVHGLIISFAIAAGLLVALLIFPG